MCVSRSIIDYQWTYVNLESRCRIKSTGKELIINPNKEEIESLRGSYYLVYGYR